MVKKVFAMVFLIVFSMNIVSSEIMLSQPENIYNLGDILKINLTIKESQDKSGFFELYLTCENKTTDFYKQPLHLKAGESREIETSLLLTKEFGIGKCKIKADFSGETATSQKFRISDKIDIVLNIENLTILPGKEVLIKGNARKENGENVEGFLEINLENKNISINRDVVNGSFSASFLFPEDAPSQNYILSVKVYDKLGEEVMNSGEERVSIFVERIAKKVDIAISNQNLIPGESVVLQPLIYDQAGQVMEGDVVVELYDSKDRLFLKEILDSGEEKNISLETNATPGYWKVKVSALGLESERAFYVEELQKAKFEIKGEILTITNIGNTPYKNTIKIFINDQMETKNINLEIGESKDFKLTAPEGKYKIAVTDGVEKIESEGIVLTGGAVGVNELRNAGVFTKYPVVWLFLIVVLGMFLFVISKRVVKKKFYGVAVEGEEKKKEEKKIKISQPQKLVEKAPVKPIEKGEHTLVLDGIKERSSLIAVKIENLENIRKKCGETISKIFRTIIENKGVVYETPKYLIGIFSPQITKTFRNEMSAIITARKIEKILEEHNQKFKIKINYGISLNSGELISKKEDGVLKFTAIGNTLNLTRKISELAKNELLLSHNLYAKVMGEVKANKEVREGVEVYMISSVSNREKYAKFIQEFLEKQKTEK